MALNSGKKIVRRSWHVIPIPDVVISRVNELVKDQLSLMMFTDRHGRPLDIWKSQEWILPKT
jgi:predicted RNA-binding protein associated with RNAse of E/G family